MQSQGSFIDFKNPAHIFFVGLSVILLAYWIPYIPNWFTFIHMWRAEFGASVLLLGSLVYLIYRSRGRSLQLSISRDEIRFILIPILAFIAWSAASMIWAPSWKSALHHTLIWSAYMIFYLIARQLIETGTNFGKAVSIIVAAFVLISIPAVLEYCAFLIYGGATTLGLRYAKYGEPIVTILPLAIAGILRLRGKRFVLGVSAVVALWLLIFCSFGRVNMVLFAGGVGALALVVFANGAFKKYRRKMVWIVAAVVVSPIPLHLFSLFSVTPDVPVLTRFAVNESTVSSANFRKLMTALSLEMFRANPVTGIGADNFGMQAGRYRAAYAAENPDDVNLTIGESEFPERAHNEYLQVLAELGLIGAAILLSLLFGIAMMALCSFRPGTSLFALAAIIGLALFLTSSLLSSYSFRFVQNGFVFFFVLAVAAKLLLKTKYSAGPRFGVNRTALAIALIPCLALMAYSVVRAASARLVERASRAATLAGAKPDFELATALDDENPFIPFNRGRQFLLTKRYPDAVPEFSRSVEMGLNRSSDFSYLATAQIMSHDLAGAEQTFSRAATMYPYSTFALTRYAALLEHNGKRDQAAEMFNKARSIDKRSANTWRTILTENAHQAEKKAVGNEVEYVRLEELSPRPALYAVVLEYNLTNPDRMIKLEF